MYHQVDSDTVEVLTCVFPAMWTLIKKLLTAEQQKFVLLVKKVDMTQYINNAQLPIHMGGTVS